MRRIRLGFVLSCRGALILAVGMLAGFTPAGAAFGTEPRAVDGAGRRERRGRRRRRRPADQARHLPRRPSATRPTPPAPLAGPARSLSVPINALANEIGGTCCRPGRDIRDEHDDADGARRQRGRAGQRLLGVGRCSCADAASSCSTTAVGLDQAGAIGSVNVPVTAQDNAIGLLDQAASALGLTTGQSPSSTTQNGAINVFVPVTICSVNVGLVGNTASDCNLSGTHGTTTQQGVVDAAVPVTVCDVIAEIDGNSTANCPQEPDNVSQSGQLADVDAPATGCGVVAAVDGTARACMPDAGFPQVNNLPTNSVTQSAPVDGVAPVNVCSVVVAVDGTASNSCEPAHVLSTSSGSFPVAAPVTVCAVTAAVYGTADGTCTGAGSASTPIGGPGGPGSGVTCPSRSVALKRP